jgi:two-component system response regulator WspF
VRIAIVNDMLMASELLRRTVLSVAGYTIAWMARDGSEAVELCRQDRPDLILMDLIMPVLNGVEATRQIMAHTPCPILVVTAAVEDQQAKVFDALGAGALDVVQTPVLRDSGDTQGAAALKFKIASIGRLLTEDCKKLVESSEDQKSSAPVASRALIAIGASAGGPAAVATILSRLPGDFRAAIVIVQHVDSNFIPSMANWLGERSSLAVEVAKSGDCPRDGNVFLAGTNHHLVLAGPHRLTYTPEPRDHRYCPSIDVFFDSVARAWKGRAVGVLLTGMGRDGAAGLKTMRDAGFLTIGQDRASCIVYGMPKAAAEMGSVAKVLPLDQIADELIRFVSKEGHQE